MTATQEAWGERPFCMPKRDCVKLSLFAIKKMGVKVPKVDKLIGYKNPLQARATLKRVYGIETVPEFFDQFFDRIPVANALLGDVICLPGHEEATLGAVSLYSGNGMVYGYVEGHERPVQGRITFEPGAEPTTAWRVLP